MKLCLPLLVLALGATTLPAMAQIPPAEPAKAAASKDAPKTTPKAAPKAVKKDAPAKDAKKAAPPSKTQVSKNVTVYTNTPPPALKDKQGKDIPVTPDAYDVSSALPKKK